MAEGVGISPSPRVSTWPHEANSSAWKWGRDGLGRGLGGDAPSIIQWVGNVASGDISSSVERVMWSLMGV